jgi:hypothetical protein
MNVTTPHCPRAAQMILGRLSQAVKTRDSLGYYNQISDRLELIRRILQQDFTQLREKSWIFFSNKNSARSGRG